MSQLILKPDDKAVGRFIVQGPLSQKELSLGKVIDLSRLLPGDLVLVSACHPGFVGRSIQKVQERGGYMREHAVWQHAALYIGKGVICEANRNGVRRDMLSKYVGDHHLRFRRNPHLTVPERYELAIHALASQGISYDFREIIRLWKAARFGFGNSTKANVQLLGKQYPKRATICSQLYADCHVSVTKTVIGNLDGGETTPACLSMTALLVDVPVTWLEIPDLPQGEDLPGPPA
ncbi:hypothetical protein HF313_13925 [Massilia atriviolacea]|uniref:Uncharacterized protein n=1 Tax=Massilia atriviolacea TaxID=2495579 RepID=A0A430HQM6_9BURK|nr:hypothetical protein [Massilia atriviolacea]RSZ59826.1 hypothetical protein EJB06_06455 [Massilia atriviolacea]